LNQKFIKVFTNESCYRFGRTDAQKREVRRDEPDRHGQFMTRSSLQSHAYVTPKVKAKLPLCLISVLPKSIKICSQEWTSSQLKTGVRFFV